MGNGHDCLWHAAHVKSSSSVYYRNSVCVLGYKAKRLFAKNNGAPQLIETDRFESLIRFDFKS